MTSETASRLDDGPAAGADVPVGRAGGDVAAPVSKSHAQRALVLAALATGRSTLRGPRAGLPDDVARTVAALRALAFDVRTPPCGAVSVLGAGGSLPASTARLDLGGSGTALRLLTAMACLGPGPYELTGDAALRARPIGGLLDALAALGADVRTTDGCAPAVVRGPVRADRGTLVEVDARGSSQGLSALLLLGAALPHGLTVAPTGRSVSAGYVDLTCDVLADAGVAVQRGLDGRFVVVPGRRAAFDVTLDGDWSSAAFLLALGPATGGRVAVTGLPPAGRGPRRQPDDRIVDVLRAFGAEVCVLPERVEASGALTQSIDVDLGDAPDLAPLVGALACRVRGTTVVRGAAHLRVKESDRIAAVVAAARALGCVAVERADGFEVTGPAPSHAVAEVITRGDHRLAMAFAVAGASPGGPRVRLDDTRCVAKSFPGFWRDVSRLLSG